ncbi:hypothetical protein [Vibrio phage vB_ValS_PJ32]|nr:hypothetical protein [Vibrio phage vB_ValS_PJ32]
MTERDLLMFILGAVVAALMVYLIMSGTITEAAERIECDADDNETTGNN